MESLRLRKSTMDRAGARTNACSTGSISSSCCTIAEPILPTPGEHQRKGFMRPAFVWPAAARSRHRCTRHTSSDSRRSLSPPNLALPQGGHRSCERSGALNPTVGGRQTKLGTAGRTGYRLGVKASITGILIFGPARRAQFKPRHCGIGTVIRQSRDQRVAGTALGAVDKGVTITPITGVSISCLQSSHRK